MIDELDLATALPVPTMWRGVPNVDSFDEYDPSSLGVGAVRG
nr:hypothetical protein [Halobellus ruber]